MCRVEKKFFSLSLTSHVGFTPGWGATLYRWRIVESIRSSVECARSERFLRMSSTFSFSLFPSLIHIQEKRTLFSCIFHHLNVGSRELVPFQRGIVGLHANLSHLFVISPRAENFNSGLSPGWNFTPGWNLVIFNSVWHVTPLVWYYETRVESYPGVSLSFDAKYFTPGWKYACNGVLSQRKWKITDVREDVLSMSGRTLCLVGGGRALLTRGDDFSREGGAPQDTMIGYSFWEQQNF